MNENCTICNKQFQNNSIRKRYYCSSCSRNVKNKRVIQVKPCINCNNNFSYNKKSAKYCSQKCSNDYKNKSGIYLNFRRSSVENSLLAVLWGARTRSKRLNREFSIKDEEILDLFNKQKGKCAATGITLKASKQSGFIDKDPYTISIDRIDSNKGYTLDNVQLVCTIYNIFKNTYSLEDITFVCKEFIKHNNININE